MDQLPVPKNVLDVEFKLFGALSVKQFGKVLLGSIIALGLFVIDIHPVLKYPLMAIAVGIGVGSAIIPGFEVKLFGLVKAVLVSPRYVWRKQVDVPEALKTERKLEPKGSSNSVQKQASKKNLDDEELDKLLQARSSTYINNNERDASQDQLRQVDTDDDFSDMYAEIYGTSLDQSLQARQQGDDQPPISAQSQTLAAGSTIGQKIPVGKNSQVEIKPVKNTAVRPPTPQLTVRMSNQNTNKKNLLSSYSEELAMLESQLKQLNKNGGDEQKRQQVLTRIDEIYSAVKDASMPPVNSPPKPVEATTNTEEQARLLYGIVVNKQDMPLQGVAVSVLDMSMQPILDGIVTKADGSFAIQAPLSPGEYMVKLQLDKYRFNPYKIVVDSEKLPGYKFRAL